jgi:hypothetical protein
LVAVPTREFPRQTCINKTLKKRDDFESWHFAAFVFHDFVGELF